MPLTLAFSTSACPGWELRRMADTALRLGFQGIEFAGLDHAAEHRAPDLGGADALVNAASATRQLLADSRLCICALSTTIPLHPRDEAAWKRNRTAIADAATLARALGAPILRVLGHHAQRGESLREALVRIATRLRTLAGDTCGTTPTPNLRLALQNGGSFVRAKDLWTLLEVANAPHAALAWDAGEAALPSGGNESPALAVQTLNARLALIHLWDHNGSPAPVPLGTGIVNGRLLLHRLRGIGYNGCLVYAPPPGATPPDLAEPLLEAAAKTLLEWTTQNPNTPRSNAAINPAGSAATRKP
jgi:sugar phosphate isomerase/epimerase